MSGDDGVRLALDELDQLMGDLATSLETFENAVQDRENLQEAVGRPDDRGGLLSKVGAFEDKWNNTRGDLKDGISKVHDQLKDIVDGFRALDDEMNAQFETESG